MGVGTNCYPLVSTNENVLSARFFLQMMCCSPFVACRSNRSYPNTRTDRGNMWIRLRFRFCRSG